MIELQFQPEAIRMLALCLMGTYTLLYLFRNKSERVDTKYFTAAVVATTLTGVVWLLEDAVVSENAENFFRALAQIGQLMTLGFLLQFVFKFLDDPFPREARWWLVALLLSGASPILGFLFLDTIQDYSAPLRFTIVGIFIVGLLVHAFNMVWIGVVGLRKSVRFSRRALGENMSDSGDQDATGMSDKPVGLIERWSKALKLLIRPVGKDANTMRIASLLGLIWITPFLTLFLTFDDSGEIAEGTATIVSFLLSLFLFVNRSNEPTTLQVKVVGFSLGMVLVALTAVGFQYLSPDALLANGAIELPQGRSLRFIPTSDGGTRILNEPLEVEHGEAIQLEFDTNDYWSQQDLGFSFPFQRAIWDSVYVSPYGTIQLLSDSSSYFIVALTSQFKPDAGGSVTYSRTTEKTIVTWNDVRHDSTTKSNTFQMILHAHGEIAFNYISVSSAEKIGQLASVGIGIEVNRSVANEAERYVDFTSESEITLPPGTVPVMRLSTMYRASVHQQVVPLMLIMLFSSVFIGLFLPLLFRSTIFRPVQSLLHGMNQVEQGSLDTKLPVGIPDEMGRLAQYFNKMASSLSKYRTQMESLVRERTAQLEASMTELEETQERLVQTEKLASLGKLTSGLAHEIKNPLNMVNNFADVNLELADEAIEAISPREGSSELSSILTDIKENSAIINRQGRRVDSIVESMMQHDSISSSSKESVDINRLVEDSCENVIKFGSTKGIEVRPWIVFDLSSNTGQAEVDERQIAKVINSLIENAVHSIMLKKSDQTRVESQSIVISTRRHENAVEISISDTGVGIPQEIQDRIFEPFFTTKPTGEGSTGLGLSVSHGIVSEGHQGTITVKSTEGEGANFTVVLPIKR